MDKNKIKSFAVWARRKMIESVTEKAERIGITKDKIEEVEIIQGGFKLGEETFYLSSKDRNALIHQISEKGFEEVMEEVAYTWFNRFMGLRYMEVNDYLPSGVRILSSTVEGKVEPDVLSKVSDVIEELNLDGEEIYRLLDTGNTSDREKAYRIILVKQCNELGKIIPQMFEKISDYTELLLPDNLLEEGSVIRKMVEDIEESDWKEEVEIIGWMYQYYISEKKDEVFAALKKNVKITKENIPAATQLFTPKWIVKYMVENSLGRLWLEGHPNEELQSNFKYYLEEAKQEPEVEIELQKIREEHSRLTPEDIKVLDPCMGSGHILVYAFDVLYEIYKSCGYTEREIPKLILTNNLYGLDIDDRAAQLASFALIMKARQYNRRLFREIQRENLELNLCSIQESNGVTIKVKDGKEERLKINEEVAKYFYTVNGKVDENLKNDFEYLINTFIDAKEYGSILEVEKVDFENLKNRLKEIEEDQNLMFGDYRSILLEKLPQLIKQGEIMSRKYEVCVTNPPYMGNKGMSDKLNKYLNKHYNESKIDLFAVMMEKGFNLVVKNGFNSMVTMQSWMFLGSFEKLRYKLIQNKTIEILLHMDNMVMGIAFGTSATVFRNILVDNFKSVFTEIKLIDIENDKPSMFPQRNNRNSVTKQSSFSQISGNPIAYWASDKIKEVFKNSKELNKLAEPKQGLATGDNNRFLRLWHEVCINSIGIGKERIEFNENKFKWVPCNKGGAFRRWFGNNIYVANWLNDGKEMKLFKGSVIRNERYYFKQGLTWSTLTSSLLSMRYTPRGFIFETKGSMLFPLDEKNIWYLLGLLNSKIIATLIKMISATIDYHEGPLGKLPVTINNDKYIDNLVKNNIKLSKNDWDSFETSWDFTKHPILKNLDNTKQTKIPEVFSLWKNLCEENFNQLKVNEEELNRIFIDIYGLQDELTPEVEDKDITIRKADRERDIKSFISYAVGCMFGRYSIDADGLIYAGGKFSDKWNINDEGGKVRSIKKDDDGNIVHDSWVDSRFMPDVDNIIPITEDEYFEDDIVSRFIDFVKTVYGEETLEENLDFIADSIGRKTSETSRQAIRRYFIKDFYKDHLKIYQKRPIYWMFDSGKNNGFKCLIYMHRYNDQTVAKVRTDYLHNLQRKYEAEINRQQLIVDSSESTTKDKTVAKKRIDRINKQIEECKEYDEVVAYLANEKISIDLDDGVKVNYAKFQNVKVINSKDKEVKMNLLAKI